MRTCPRWRSLSHTFFSWLTQHLSRHSARIHLDFGAMSCKRSRSQGSQGSGGGGPPKKPYPWHGKGMGGPDPPTDDEEDEAVTDLRICRKCGYRTYMRKIGCVNIHCSICCIISLTSSIFRFSYTFWPRVLCVSWKTVAGETSFSSVAGFFSFPVINVKIW